MLPTSSRLPSLGPRGEGWLIGQLLLLAAVGVLGLRRVVQATPSSGPRRALTVFGLALVVAGLLVGGRAAHDLGRNLTPLPRPRREAALVETGAYRRVRHPLYAALMLLAFGFATATASVAALISAGLLAIWLDAKARREEAWLGARFPGYRAYRARARRFVPGIY